MTLRSLVGVLLVTAVPSFAQADVDAGVELDAGVTPVALPSPVTPPPPSEPKKDDAASFKVKFGDGVTFKQGDVSINLRGRMQVQALAVVPTEGSSAHRQNAIMVRRARLALKTELPWHLSLNLQLAFANQDMEADAPNVLRDFYGTWAPLRDLSVRVGQMKVPFDVQRIVSSSSLQMVDRSLVTAEFNLDRDVGLVLFSDDLFGLGNRLRYAVGVFGGDGRNRIGTNVGLLYAGRVRFSPFGKFDDKLEGDPDRDPSFRLAFGAGVARNVQTNRPRSTTGTPYKVATFDYTHAAGDVHAKWRGFSLLSELYWRQADLGTNATGEPIAFKSGISGSAAVTEYSRSGFGYFVQGGAYLTDWLELTARFGDTRPLGPTDPTFGRTREIGGGFNLMVHKHDLKLQTDAFWLDDGTGKNGRVQLRVQAQIYF